MPTHWTHNPSLKFRLRRCLVLMLGLVAIQCVLIGPSLIGARILLPLDILSQPGTYIPVDPANPPATPRNILVSDLVTYVEPFRVFTVHEVRAGRVPLWNPYSFCGTPFLANDQTGTFCPYRLLDYAVDSPVAVAWGQLLRALVSGLGAYLFFRRAMGCRFVPALLGAWCFPVLGGMAFWAGFSVGTVFSWTPWIVLVVDAVVRRPKGMGVIGVALVTAIVLVSGHPQVAAHVLIVSGLFGLFRVAQEYGAAGFGRGATGWRGRWACLGACAALGVGWGLGILLSMPQTLPTLEYMGESHRLAHRMEHADVARAPMGLDAVPQLVFPYFHGSERSDSISLLRGTNLSESAGPGSAGLIMFGFLAPLGLASRRTRWTCVFWLGLAILAAGQRLNLPILASILDSRPLGALSNSRFVIFTGFAILCMGVAGLDALWRGRVRIGAGRNRLAWIGTVWMVPVALVAGATAFCFYRGFHFPEVLARAIDDAMTRPGHALGAAADLTAEQCTAWFRRMYLGYALVGALSILLWIALAKVGSRARGKHLYRVVAVLAGVISLGELTANAYDLLPQSDPKIYYPLISVMNSIKAGVGGRVCGVEALPPNLNMMLGVADIRGYDAVDPEAYVDLAANNDPSINPESYARLMGVVPRPGPIADLLGLRYYVLRGSPPKGASVFATGPDYWVVENPRAMPRAYVPENVATVNDAERRLNLIRDPRFDPRKVAFCESLSALGSKSRRDEFEPTFKEVRGNATIREEDPQRVVIDADMKTTGMLVLADRWASGWEARVDGAPTAVYRVNHAFRGVILPAGKWSVDFAYRPGGFRTGITLAWVALAGMLGWAVWSGWLRHLIYGE